jgi:hypothetical protein
MATKKAAPKKAAPQKKAAPKKAAPKKAPAKKKAAPASKYPVTLVVTTPEGTFDVVCDDKASLDAAKAMLDSTPSAPTGGRAGDEYKQIPGSNRAFRYVHGYTER